MANKRKSMNASDAHAYKLRRSTAADLSAIKGFQGCCPDKWGPMGIACPDNKKAPGPEGHRRTNWYFNILIISLCTVNVNTFRKI